MKAIQLTFLSYHFLGTFTRNSAEDGSLNPFIASWLPNLIMLPLGVYLIWRASLDKSIFNFDKITYPFKVFLNKILSFRKV